MNQFINENGLIYEIVERPNTVEKRCIGPVNYEEEQGQEIVSFSFNMETGQYVEQSRTTRAEPLPPVPPTVEEQITQLKAENATLNQRLAQTNADAVGFQEFIFASFPELA